MIKLINPKYLEMYEEEVTQPEIIAVWDGGYTWVGTGEDEISLPDPSIAQVGPQKKVKITKYRIKVKYAHLPLVELLY